MRAVVLAGGMGSRLAPMTAAVNKHLLPLCGEPMIHHGLRQLQRAAVGHILVITSAHDLGQVARALGAGGELGLELSYRVQERPGGIAHALALAEDFVGDDEFVLLLGDNIFAGDLSPFIQRPLAEGEAARVLLHEVDEPQRYGVAELDTTGTKIVDLAEKPSAPRSNLAVIGAYRYTPEVFDILPTLRPSARGELEITDVNARYMRAARLGFEIFSGEWIDAGTHESYRKAEQILRAWRDDPQAA